MNIPSFDYRLATQQTYLLYKRRRVYSYQETSTHGSDFKVIFHDETLTLKEVNQTLIMMLQRMYYYVVGMETVSRHIKQVRALAANPISGELGLHFLLTHYNPNNTWRQNLQRAFEFLLVLENDTVEILDSPRYLWDGVYPMDKRAIAKYLNVPETSIDYDNAGQKLSEDLRQRYVEARLDALPRVPRDAYGNPNVPSDLQKKILGFVGSGNTRLKWRMDR
jgi:hypothetical protein